MSPITLQWTRSFRALLRMSAFIWQRSPLFPLHANSLIWPGRSTSRVALQSPGQFDFSLRLACWCMRPRPISTEIASDPAIHWMRRRCLPLVTPMRRQRLPLTLHWERCLTRICGLFDFACSIIPARVKRQLLSSHRSRARLRASRAVCKRRHCGSEHSIRKETSLTSETCALLMSCACAAFQIWHRA